MSPAAAPFTATDTPLSSIGSAGLRVVSEPGIGPASDGTNSTVVLMIPSSPGARPVIVPGDGLGVGLGLGLASGSGMLLAPVKKASAVADSELTGGLST